ncbi:protein FAR1-RELATED SEQUENCE 5-like isoform X2 [Gastrolobium bilobum]|nr:protein FAR1-RELATED SEQUENCE 5-like isoform X2 [Gastrolobium bilobum]
MSNAARSLVEHFSDASLPTGKVATIFKGDELSFDSRDCYNHLTSVRRRIYNAGDAQAVLNYCAKQQSLNPNFFYSIKCDDEDRMESFFWIDARSRKAYELFGDVITFDTTYRTNKYLMLFGPFVGVNNHLQSILFGCALLKDETKDTFIWLFKEWLRGMNEKHPGAIITDQYPKFSQTASNDFVCGTSQKSFQKNCLMSIRAISITVSIQKRALKILKTNGNVFLITMVFMRMSGCSHFIQLKRLGYQSLTDPFSLLV